MLSIRGPLAWLLLFFLVNGTMVLFGHVANGLVDIDTCRDAATVCGVLDDQPLTSDLDPSITSVARETTGILTTTGDVVLNANFAIFEYRHESVVVAWIYLIFQFVRIATFVGLIFTAVTSALQGVRR